MLDNGALFVLGTVFVCGLIELAIFHIAGRRMDRKLTAQAKRD